MAEEYQPLKRPGQVQSSDSDDTVLAQGVTALAGDLVLTDNNAGPKTLTQLAAAGSIDPELEQAIVQGLNTGVLDGLTVSINGGDPTTFDISAGTANVLNSYTTPTVPTLTRVNFAGVAGVARTTGGNSPQTQLTLVALNGAGSVIQVAADSIDATDFRDNAFLGALWHPQGDGNVIVLTSPYGLTGQGPLHDLYDFRNIFGALRVDGLIYSANGANQSLNRSSGTANSIGAFGFDSSVKRKSPSQRSYTTVFLADIYRAYRDGSGGLVVDGPTTAWDPGVWDDGTGNLAAFPGSDSYGIARGYLGPDESTILGPPQNTYKTQADAIAALTNPIVELGFLTTLIPTTWCVFRKDATVFTDPEEAQFFEIPPLFRLGGGGVSGTTGATIVTRFASTVATATHAIRDPAAASIILTNAGEISRVTAAFPSATLGGGGDFDFLIEVGPLGGALTTVGTVTVAQGQFEGELVPGSPVAFNDGDAVQVSETDVGTFVGGATNVQKRCVITAQYTET